MAARNFDRRAAICLLAILVAAESRGAQPRTSSDADFQTQQDLLFLAPDAPVVIRLTCRREPSSTVTARNMFARSLLDRLDTNDDGMLDPMEAAKTPGYGRFSQAKRLGNDWQRIDTAPRDGEVSVEELAEHVAVATRLKVRLKAGVSARADTLDLHWRLDSNADGQISIGELQAAHDALRQCDFDDDDTFSIVELEELTDSAVFDPSRRKAATATLPFVSVDEDSRDAVAELLVTTYSGSVIPAGARSESSAAEERPEAQHGLDTDGDGRVGMQEARQFLGDLQPDFELTVEYNRPGAGRVAWSPAGDASDTVLRFSARRRQTVDMAGIQLLLRLQNTTVLTRFIRDLCRDQFRVADRNRNKYIEDSEFSGLDLPGKVFDDVDFDDDGQIVSAELETFIEQELLISQSTVTVSVENERESLFEILDDNKDGRLAPRELIEGADRIAQRDLNGNQQIAEGELLVEHGLTFGLGVARLSSQLVQTPTRGSSRSAAYLPPADAPGEGPLWFRRMDRNRDGDVSWREFLGPSDRFVRIDVDGDTLIDATEAVNASAAVELQ